MNWGQGIAVFMTIFICFMGTLVYMTTRSQVDLEAADYYQQELAYQGTIDAIERGKAIAEMVDITALDGSLRIQSAAPQVRALPVGRLLLKRPNDPSKDMDLPLDLSTGLFQVPADMLTTGQYTLQLIWPEAEGDLAVARKIYIN